MANATICSCYNSGGHFLNQKLSVVREYYVVLHVVSYMMSKYPKLNPRSVRGLLMSERSRALRGSKQRLNITCTPLSAIHIHTQLLY